MTETATVEIVTERMPLIEVVRAAPPRFAKAFGLDAEDADLGKRIADIIAAEHGVAPDDQEFVWKGIVAEDLQVDPDERAVVAYISTGAIDRDMEILQPKGLILKHYRKNKVVGYGHDYSSRLPIGKNLWIKQGPKGPIAKTIFTPRPPNSEGKNWLADDVLWLIQNDVINTTSVGFMPVKFHEPTEKELADTPEWADVRRIYDKWELLEYSFVPIPSNPEALVLAKGANLSGRVIVDLGGGKAALEIADGDHKDADKPAKKYTCECLECGHKIDTDEHCREIKCPKCGGEMRRAERPGPGREADEVVTKPGLDETDTSFRYRLRDPADFVRMRTITLQRSPVIKVVVGPLKSDPDGPTKVQALIFPKDADWTKPKVQAWLKAHPDVGKGLTPWMIGVLDHVEDAIVFGGVVAAKLAELQTRIDDMEVIGADPEPEGIEVMAPDPPAAPEPEQPPVIELDADALAAGIAGGVDRALARLEGVAASRIKRAKGTLEIEDE